MLKETKERKGPGGLWVLILGLGGFCAGFFGPILLNPSANQGPLVGIFITGPLGVVLGIAGLILSSVFGVSSKNQWLALKVFTTILIVGTLGSALPKAERIGRIVEIKIKDCKPSFAIWDETRTYWEKRIANVTWAKPRENWQEEINQILEQDKGVILNVTVLNQNYLVKGRKPWNKGRFYQEGWLSVNEDTSFYFSETNYSCADFKEGSQGKYFHDYDLRILNEANNEWPPTSVRRILPRFYLKITPTSLLRFENK